MKQSEKSGFFPDLEIYLLGILDSLDEIPEQRKILLNRLVQYIVQQHQKTGPVKLVFICTHNSRRSHMGQLWAQIAASYYDISGIITFSGGTEATAFNPRAVAAMQRAGLQITGSSTENPKYLVKYADQAPGMIAFSKRYDDPVNPGNDFAAIMTCSEADESCPIVPGASLRVPLHYNDPKDFDGTDQESSKYDERCRQIAMEMFYVFSQV